MTGSPKLLIVKGRATVAEGRQSDPAVTQRNDKIECNASDNDTATDPATGKLVSCF